jgi:hypothetical protein
MTVNSVLYSRWTAPTPSPSVANAGAVVVAKVSATVASKSRSLVRNIERMIKKSQTILLSRFAPDPIRGQI